MSEKNEPHSTPKTTPGSPVIPPAVTPVVVKFLEPSNREYPQQPLIDVINNNSLIALLFSGHVCAVCARKSKTLRPFHGIQLCAVHRNQISRKHPPAECVDYKGHGFLRLTHSQPSDCHACTTIIVRQLTGRGGG
ncbi:unnamed protein product, partial [Mesorhabditis spiculigera]